ncbi:MULTISPECIES: transporter substrate-binding domain-containing protein [unclassified Halomonas]|uniref:substrate-binding periplasmic protein n=1 Tax=unclassified Halomonas TaxID=2609666 RepID=UPI000B123D8E|nr:MULTISPECIES: transporter substrate-binding domain-containing protein [unclassified Halomonas]
MANDVTRRWRYRMGVALLTTLGSYSMSLHSMPLAATTEALPLTINTEEYPPFNYTDDQGQIIGSATLLLRNALRQADIEAYFRLRPWARAYTEARLRDNHCVYSTTRTQEREALFHWVGPLVVNEWAAFSLAERGLSIASLSELHAWRVGSFREDAVGDYVASRGINVLLAPSERENIARLKAGLLDVIVTGKATGEFMAQEQDIALAHLFTFYRAPLYLACHPSVPEALLARLQTQLDTLHRNAQEESQ